MPKTQIVPCSKEEIEKIINASMINDYFYMLFNVAKTTGRRIGELYGVQRKVEIGRKIVGKKTEYDMEGKEIALSKTIPIYKKTNEWDYGVKVKDVDLVKGIMRIWVLKRRQFIQDETILTPETCQLISHYIVKTKKTPEDYLFRDYSYRGIQAGIISYAKKAGVGHKVSFHNFRHYFVTELKRMGWTNDNIAKLTGHKTPSVLSIYDHIVATDIKDKALRDIREI